MMTEYIHYPRQNPTQTKTRVHRFSRSYKLHAKLLRKSLSKSQLSLFPGDSKVTVRGRYAEPRVAQLVGEDIILLSRFASSEEMSKSDPKDKEAEPPAERTEGLRNAIEAARKRIRVHAYVLL
jgi:hypothetical protein